MTTILSVNEAAFDIAAHESARVGDYKSAVGECLDALRLNIVSGVINEIEERAHNPTLIYYVGHSATKTCRAAVNRMFDNRQQGES